MRKPTKDEEIQAWHRLAWQLNLHRCITMNHEGVLECLKNIDSWVNAHADANGERPHSEVQRNITNAFWKNIARMEPPAVEKKVRKKAP